MCKLHVDITHGHVTDVPLRVVECGLVSPTVHVVQPTVGVVLCRSH